MARRGSYAKGVARRQEILESTLDVIGRTGYRNASLKQIAEAVGVTPAALLHYFGSKEELFTEVLRTRDDQDERSPRIHESVDAKAAFLDVIRHNTEVPGVVELFSRLAVDAADPDHPAHAYFLQRSERLRGSIAAAFHGDAATRAALDADTTARIVQAVADGLQLQWLIDPSVDMPGILEALMDVLYPPTVER
ncbi:TetR/AcrR family transcriptional regulator [Microbacterium hydrocarbonoxydans]|uniref:TetR/AcrR family transcriptional regulator n=1 Tax=Microbacterium hydrocarbonoxydans TaxID=273678 RepID=UPI00203FEF27|nr:TetR/AcrR family transcriptional regulator [Microbacterium hydrocarbonoxydans]MCM3778069.1 TetR/AcrR family transcriptional regulator [Microbacterium hydrocarbonoxydans]